MPRAEATHRMDVLVAPSVEPVNGEAEGEKTEE